VSADAGSDAPVGLTEHRLSLRIDPAAGACTIVMRSGTFTDGESSIVVAVIDRVFTEDSAGCKAGVLFDLASEPPGSPDEPNDALSGGVIALPGKLGEVSKDADGPLGGFFEDLSFDGVMDLCVVQAYGAYNYSQRCWVFDKTTRRFARVPGLDEHLFLSIDVAHKRLISSYRLGGQAYTRLESGWVNGKLVTLRRVTSYLGETPSGETLEQGGVYEVVHERRGNKLVKVSERVVR
jgi:hypothetical protein